jgi:hypothetical protein
VAHAVEMRRPRGPASFLATRAVGLFDARRRSRSGFRALRAAPRDERIRLGEEAGLQPAAGMRCKLASPCARPRSCSPSSRSAPLTRTASGRASSSRTGDDFAYASAALDLAEGTSLVHHYESPGSHAVHLDRRPPGAYASRYPLGLSLLLVPFYLLGGFAAMWALGPSWACSAWSPPTTIAWQLARRRDVALVAAALVATVPAVVIAGRHAHERSNRSMTLVSRGARRVYLRLPRAAARRDRLPSSTLLAGAAFLVRNPKPRLVVGRSPART